MVAAAVGLAVATAPIAVDAAKRTARSIAVDKKGRAKVVVSNQPSVTVRGGVTVANEPNVKVPGGVSINNRPTVDVGNHPSELSVKAAPGKLTATTRPPLDEVFSVNHVDVQSLAPRPIMVLSGTERAALTHVFAGVHNIGNPVDEPTVVDLVLYERTSGNETCGLAGWTASTLRRITLRTDTSIALDVAGAPFVAKAQDNGEPRCLAFKLYQWVGETKVDLGASGYRF